MAAVEDTMAAPSWWVRNKSGVTFGTVLIVAVLTYWSAESRSNLWFVWVLPFFLSVWIRWRSRTPREAASVALAYGFGLLPAIGLVVHEGDTAYRLVRSLDSGRVALFGIPVVLVIVFIAVFASGPTNEATVD